MDFPLLDNKQVVVSFKYKGMDSLGQHGPVIVIDVAAFKDGLLAMGIEPADNVLHTPLKVGAPRPAGMYDIGWLPRSIAVKVAKHYGVTLKEF